MKRSNPPASVATAAPKRSAALRKQLLGAGALVASTVLTTTAALAQSQGIGSRVTALATESSTAGGQMASAAAYLAAAICFIYGAWALWQSRQEQNRGGGYVARGLAGLVLCGLFASGPTWIGLASQSTSGVAPTTSTSAAQMQFQ